MSGAYELIHSPMDSWPDELVAMAADFVRRLKAGPFVCEFGGFTVEDAVLVALAHMKSLAIYHHAFGNHVSVRQYTREEDES